MNFGELIYHQPYNIKQLLRKIENLEKKLVNARVAIVFNKTCLNENLLPTFTYTYIYIKTCFVKNQMTFFFNVLQFIFF